MKLRRFFLCVILFSLNGSLFANERLEWLQGLGFAKNKKSPFWAISYQKDINQYFTFEYYYLNEGDIRGNKRDGVVTALAANVPLFTNDLILSFTAGPYVYANTQMTGGQNYSDQFGIGAMFGASLRYKLPFIPIYLKTYIGKVIAQNQINTLMLGMAVGVNFDQKYNHTLKGHPDNKLTLTYGRSILNSVNDESGSAYGLEYAHRFSLNPYLGYAFGFYHETAKTFNYQVGGKLNRNDYYGELNWNSDLNDYFGISIGAGPDYITQGAGIKNGRLDMITGVTFSVSPVKNLSLLFRWNRVLSFDNTDTDMFMGGLSLNF